MRAGVADHSTPKLMPTCSGSGGEEHGNRGEPSKCGVGQGMLLERALLGDAVVAARGQDISRRWLRCPEPDYQHCFAGDGASCLRLRRLIFRGGNTCSRFFL